MTLELANVPVRAVAKKKGKKNKLAALDVHNSGLAAMSSLATVPTAATVDLAEWAQELRAAYIIGESLCKTEFVPSAFRGKPESAAAAILAGKALGLDPMNSLANIFVVHGRPAMYARTMAALVMSAGHTIRRVEATEQRVVFEGRRAGDTGPYTRVEWTIQRASIAGYVKTNGKYKENPIEMLTAKCQAELCRVIAPDVLTGISAMSVEEAELENIGEIEEGVDATPAPKQRVQRKQRQQPAPVAPAAVQDAPRDLTPVDDEADALAEAANEETGELPEQEPATALLSGPGADLEPLSTPEQQKALGEALKAAGFTTKAAMMTKVTDLVGRDVASSKELTETEAADVTAQLWDEADATTPEPAGA